MRLQWSTKHDWIIIQDFQTKITTKKVRAAHDYKENQKATDNSTQHNTHTNIMRELKKRII